MTQVSMKSQGVEYLWRVARLSREAIRCLIPKILSPEALGSLLQNSPEKLWQLLPKRFAKKNPPPLKPFETNSAPFPFLTYLDQAFPLDLQPLHSPPCVLYYQGDRQWLSSTRPRIAIIGTRQASPYAREVCATLVRAMLPYQPVILSGMALGIDGVAHRSALEVGLPSIGVLGTPLNRPYPLSHRQLHQDMQQQGLLLSELDPDAPMGAWRFPERNRILAALAHAILVVEAPESSGALLTAHEALELGKEIFVVPGPLRPNRNRGGHRLIQQGAHLLSQVQEIFEILGTPLVSRSKPLKILEQAQGEEAQILRILTEGPQPIDKIVHISDLAAPLVTSTLMSLSLKGWVQELPGRFFKIIE